MADAEFSERLNQLLSNPEALSQILNTAMSLFPSGKDSGGRREDRDDPIPAGKADFVQEQESEPASRHEFRPEPKQTSDDALPVGAFSGLKSGGFDNFGGSKIGSGRPDSGRTDSLNPYDHRCELLRALKPYLRHSRADKVDMMIKVLQVSALTRSTFGGKSFR